MRRTGPDPDETAHAGDASGLNRRISLVVLGARLGMLWERIWPRLVPAVAIAAVFCILSWLGLWPGLNPWLRIALVGVFALALLVSLFPLVRVRLPSPA